VCNTYIEIFTDERDYKSLLLILYKTNVIKSYDSLMMDLSNLQKSVQDTIVEMKQDTIVEIKQDTFIDIQKTIQDTIVEMKQDTIVEIKQDTFIDIQKTRIDDLQAYIERLDTHIVVLYFFAGFMVGNFLMMRYKLELSKFGIL
jgi:hypothetical protein